MSHQHTPETPQVLDEWHDQPVRPKEEIGAHINVPFLMVFFVVMVVFILFTVGALIVFFNYTKTNLASQLVENTYEYQMEYKPYAEESKGRLNEYAWVSREDETVRIPWQVAARSVVDDYAGPGSDAEESSD